MPQDRSEDQESNVQWFNMVDEEPLDDEIDLENYDFGMPEVSFEDSLAAIQGDALAPLDVLGFNQISRKNIHALRSVWTTLPEQHRVTLSDLVLMVARENPYTDFGRFFQVLLEDGNDAVRLNAAAGAGLSEDTALIAPLIDLAEHDANQDLREAAILALAPQVVALDMGMVGDARDRQRLSKLKAWALDTSWPSALRAAALEAHSYDEMDEDTGDIIRDFIAGDDDVLQLGAMRAMVQYGAGQFTRFLEKELLSNDVDRREAAAQAMGMSGDEAVLPMLTMAAREDTESVVREAAYTSLGNIASKQSLQALIQLRQYASDDDLEVIDSAIQYAQDFQNLEQMAEFEMLEFESDDDYDDEE